MSTHLRIILLGVAWFLLGGLLAVGLFVRLTGVSSSIAGFTNQQLPMALAIEQVRSEMLEAQATCQQLALMEDQASVEQGAATLRGQLWKIEADMATLATRTVDSNLQAAFRPGFDAAGAWHRAARMFMAEREGDLSAARRPDNENMLAEVSAKFTTAENEISQFMHQDLRPALEARAEATRVAIASVRNDSMMLIGLASAAGCALTVLMARAVRAQQITAAAAQAKQAFDARVSNSLNMAQTETEVLQLAEDIIAGVDPNLPAALLIADSSRAHLAQTAATPAAGCSTDGAPLCGVRAPGACPAVRRGFEVTFRSSSDFDSCPHLRRRATGPCSATCVPITITGQQVGVLHAVTPDHQPLPDESISRLTVIAAKLGERIGVIRAFNQSEDQATKDALTGLLNRRSTEEAIQRLQRDGTRFCVVYADIDHFKRLNDTYGHETGDRALRLFSRVLTDSLRPSDVISRWGGEEFVMILPNTSAELAKPIIERLRVAISENTGLGAVPAVTASFGIAECGPSDDFAERLNEADAALLLAKQNGRNRIALAGSLLAAAG